MRLGVCLEHACLSLRARDLLQKGKEGGHTTTSKDCQDGGPYASKDCQYHGICGVWWAHRRCPPPNIHRRCPPYPGSPWRRWWAPDAVMLADAGAPAVLAPAPDVVMLADACAPAVLSGAPLAVQVLLKGQVH